MSIKPGDAIPDVPVKRVTADGVSDASTAEILGKGRVVLFTVPGAFTPTCTVNHLPGYVAAAQALRDAGADAIVCAAANDQHVVKAWAEATGALGKVDFIADGLAAFAKALGIERDLSAGGLGIRYARAALLIEDGVVEAVNVETVPGEVDASSAETMLALLRGKAA